MHSNIFFDDKKHSSIILNKENMIFNCRFVKNKVGKICAMVKANAYGHGLKETVNILKDEVDFFGTSNMQEAEAVRELTNKGVIVFGKCEDYAKCIEKDISFALLSLKHANEMIKIYKSGYKKPRMHLCVNSGMNRYGVKDKREIKKIIKLLQDNGIELEGFYTHFSSLTTDSVYTKRQREIFEEYSSFLPKSWNTIKHIGGGNTIFTDIKADMHRVGLFLYGYGTPGVKRVLKIESVIVDLQNVKKGEHVGYLSSFTAPKNMKIATIPLGYGDGLPRKLSNKISVEIGGKKAPNVGNICMDAFMVDVSGIDCKIGDKVVVMDDATIFAEILGTTEYEVLTNFSKFRGNRLF